MKKSIFNIAILLCIFSVVLSSCSKDDEVEEIAESSFSMSYDGVTYTEVVEGSLILAGGNIGVVGSEENEFSLIISGVGADGTTTNIVDENGDVYGSVILDFGAVVGKEGFVASSGTIKRTGKKIEVNVSGITTSLVPKSLTAVIEVQMVIAN